MPVAPELFDPKAPQVGYGKKCPWGCTVKGGSHRTFFSATHNAWVCFLCGWVFEPIEGEQ